MGNWANHPMFDLSPSFLEVQAAKAVFLEMLQQYRPYTRYQPGSSLYMSPETVVACALAGVWRQGRKYQRDRDSDTLFELAGMGGGGVGMRERDKAISRISDMLYKITDVKLLNRIYRFTKYIYIHRDGREAA